MSPEGTRRTLCAVLITEKRGLTRRSPAITPWEHDQAQQLTKSLPYSDHSSFSELESFVSQLRPQAILPVVKPPHNQGYCTDPQVQFRHLLRPLDAGRQSWLPDSTRVSTASEGHAPLCWQVMMTKQSMFAATLCLSFSAPLHMPAGGCGAIVRDDSAEKNGASEGRRVVAMSLAV